MSEDKDMQVPLDKSIGYAIRKFRKKKRMTQKQLTKSDDPSRRILSERTLGRIERGETPLSPKYLDEILQELGVSYAEFFSEVEGPDSTLFLNGFSEVWDLLFEKKHEEASKRLNELLLKSKVDLRKPHIAQALMLYNCRVEVESLPDNADFDLYQEELSTSLCLTSPYAVADRNGLILAKVASNVFTLNEYRIMNIMAALNELRGDTNAAVGVYRAMKKSLKNKTLSSEIRNKLLPTVCYNLADSLTNQCEFGEAITTAETGLTHGKKVGNHKADGSLYYAMAKALQLNGELEKAAENFGRSYASFKAQGREESAKKVKDFAADKYGVFIKD